MEETSNEKSASRLPKILVPILLFVFVITSIITYLLYLQGYQKTITPKEKPQTAAATVNNQEISRKEFEAVVAVTTDSKSMVMDNFIKAEILSQYLEQKNVKTTAVEVKQSIKYDDDIDANETLNAKIRLLSTKIKAIDQLSDSQFDEWYASEKKKAKINIMIEL